MQLENRFDVSASPEAAWNLLNDVPTVLPCMPGAELLEVVDLDNWKAKLHIRLGPISLQFLADLSREATVAADRRAVLSVDAREAKGRGTARATITSTVETGSCCRRTSETRGRRAEAAKDRRSGEAHPRATPARRRALALANPTSLNVVPPLVLRAPSRCLVDIAAASRPRAGSCQSLCRDDRLLRVRRRCAIGLSIRWL
jgi:carbon monoxide dehydrogenase subunit G